MNKIVIIGASGHAKVIIDIIEKQGEYEILGLLDTYKPKNQSILGYKILGTEDYITDLLNAGKIIGGIIAIGDNFTRKNLYKKIAQNNPNFKFITAIHPSAIIGKNVTIGDGTVIMPAVVVNINSTIGIQVILNTKCSIDHDNCIDDFSSVSPGATMGGNVRLGKCSSVSLGANIIENISIGNNTIIGSGSLVLNSFGDNEVVYGVPAKMIRKREASDCYLGLSKPLK
ncbi:acetyltransferase [Pseudotamlana agarivorans]|uniref:acetyltransferase n=1 Tax=Pseudotamlana agarivorans TaxID=481183 RepID=UPI0008337F79|nr:acetyltransferase [Tamlana agarivorans]